MSSGPNALPLDIPIIDSFAFTWKGTKRRVVWDAEVAWMLASFSFFLEIFPDVPERHLSMEGEYIGISDHSRGHKEQVRSALNLDRGYFSISRIGVNSMQKAVVPICSAWSSVLMRVPSRK